MLHHLGLDIRARVVPNFAAVLALPEAPSVIAVDIPIGLLDTGIKGGRECELEARDILRRPRRSSIFSAPSRAALAAFRAKGNYAAVSNANKGHDASGRGLSQQSFAILSKIDEVDAALTSQHQRVVREVHPELCFTEANGGTPMVHSKKRSVGRTERMHLLARIGFADATALLDRPFPAGVETDDLLDACIACWSAARVAAGLAAVIPASPPIDACGLRMELWR